MLTIDRIRHAAEVLSSVVRRTDLIRAPRINCDSEIYLKTENLQVTGSFKVRGAYYKISQLTEEEKKRGVIACSAGNHAQGVALGATKNGIKSLICLPAGAPISKIEATKRLGAEVCLVNGVYDDAYAKALELRDQHGYTFVHPFDDELVIAGQGTIGLEILEQLPDVEAVIVPIGGGGLISGVALALKTLKPDVKIYGVQAAGAPSMEVSVKENKIIRLPSVSTIADGIAVKEPGVNTFKYCCEYVDEIASITDEEVATAILTLIEQHKIIAEGAGAIAVAAAMLDKFPIKGKKTVCLVSGGNVDVPILSRVVKTGLTYVGRSVSLRVELPNKPGKLREILAIIAEHGSNIQRIKLKDSSTNGGYAEIRLETRNHEHIEEIKASLAKQGYNVI
ncbi:MAG: threonine ammonia-lyase [Bacteroidaceae bacterium]|nr:threonine ammonia-lyase [Bacteroidaceae bacterium]MBR2378465.1 threonine ammonia-lyase [Bacteroidaceae bacterium]